MFITLYYKSAYKKIVLLAKTERGPSGLLLLSPKLGEYSATTHAAFKLHDGEKVDIFCPVCQADLGDYMDHQNLARANQSRIGDTIGVAQCFGAHPKPRRNLGKRIPYFYCVGLGASGRYGASCGNDEDLPWTNEGRIGDAIGLSQC